MPRVHVTSWLREVVPNAPLQAAGGTVGETLDEMFAQVAGRRTATA